MFLEYSTLHIQRQSSTCFTRSLDSWWTVGSLHDDTLCIAVFRLASFLPTFNFDNHRLESFGDVLVVARAGFHEAAAQLIGKFLTVGGGDLTLLRAEVGFVAYDHDRDSVCALHPAKGLSVWPIRFPAFKHYGSSARAHLPGD